jgi:hypothetical protein
MEKFGDRPIDSVDALTRELGLSGMGRVFGGAKSKPKWIPSTRQEMEAELQAPDIQEATREIEETLATVAIEKSLE